MLTSAATPPQDHLVSQIPAVAFVTFIKYRSKASAKRYNNDSLDHLARAYASEFRIPINNYGRITNERTMHVLEV